ncbi:MAG: hypothetical protein CL840_01575 [Crocinitomicaceae bacterium]|nr:hypothetical protein [Crocinitomicaceae bacterium]|tara:strand:- start:2504 stop:2827 length:324 start_codon:yes stop_codon:yes gene_type:complete
MKFLKLLAIAALLLLMSNIGFSQSDSTLTSEVKVKGITCSNDLKTISSNVEKLKGVTSCKTLKQGATATFEVNYNPTLVSKEEIYAAIEKTGGCENPNDRPYKVKGK